MSLATKCTCGNNAYFCDGNCNNLIPIKMEESKVKTAEQHNDNIKLIVKLEQIRNSTYNLFGKKPLAFEKSFLKNLNANGVFLFHTDKPFKDLQSHITKLENSETKLKLTLDHYDLVRVKHEDEIDLLKARVKELEEALKRITETNWQSNNGQYFGKGTVYLHAICKKIAEQALNKK